MILFVVCGTNQASIPNASTHAVEVWMKGLKWGLILVLILTMSALAQANKKRVAVLDFRNPDNAVTES